MTDVHSATRHEPRVVVIGAGVAGISMAYVLHQQGFTDWLVLEKGADVGGVWFWNIYIVCPSIHCHAAL